MWAKVLKIRYFFFIQGTSKRRYVFLVSTPFFLILKIWTDFPFPILFIIIISCRYMIT
jgi:hypothetical protein